MIDQLLEPFLDTHKGKNIYLIFVVICLIVSEKFIEADFVCPCERFYRNLFFWIYLLMPAFIGYVAMFYIVRNVEKSATTSGGPDSQPEGRGNSDIDAGVTNVPPSSSGNPLGKVETVKGSKCCITSKTVCQCVQYLIPSIVWIVLFLSDGRYVACYRTVSAEHAESSQQALWEWCDLNQTLTAEQNVAEKSYYTSKLSGFGLLFLFSFLALVYQCFYVHGKRCPTATHRWTRLTGRVV